MDCVVSGSEPQVHIGLTVSRRPCLNLCPLRWLKFILKRVSNSAIVANCKPGVFRGLGETKL